jgi:hypothetical protein
MISMRDLRYIVNWQGVAFSVRKEELEAMAVAGRHLVVKQLQWYVRGRAQSPGTFRHLSTEEVIEQVLVHEYVKGTERSAGGTG